MTCWWHLVAALGAKRVTSRDIMVTVGALACVRSTLLHWWGWGWYWWRMTLAELAHSLNTLVSMGEEGDSPV